MGQSTPVQVQEHVKRLSSEGKSSREIAGILSISQSTATGIIKKHHSISLPTKSGRPSVLDKYDERYICRLATTDKCSTAVEIKQELAAYSGMKVSSNTILWALRRNQIKSRYKKKKPQLSKSNRRERVTFEKTHRSWQESDWDKVIWSDETKINLTGSDGRERTFRKDGQRLQDPNVIPTKKFGGGSIMIAGCMLSSGVGYLCRIDGSMDAQMYLNILNDELMQTLGWYGLEKENIVFQQDNASCHTASIVKKWFKDEKINAMKWPSHSPDLNPIEHLWDHLKRKLHEAPPSHNLDQLWNQVQEVWNAIDSNVCLQLVRSMPKRLAQVRQSKGGYTKY